MRNSLHLPKRLVGIGVGVGVGVVVGVGVGVGVPHSPIISSSLTTPSLRFSSSHASTEQPEVSEPTHQIRELLRRNGSWEHLNSSFRATRITDTIVEKVLLDLRDPKDAKKALLFFHWSANHRGHRHTLSSYCLTVHILVRAGLIVDARALLESAVKIDEPSELTMVQTLVRTHDAVLQEATAFDLLIISLSKLRSFKLGLEAISYLTDRGVSLSLDAYNAFLKSLERSGELELLWEVFEGMLWKRRYPNQKTVQIMVDALCKEGKLQEMVRVLDRIRGKRSPPSVVVGTALALRIIDGGGGDRVMLLLTRMLQKNMVFDDVACSLYVYAYSQMGDIDMAYSSFDAMIRRGLDANPFVYTSLIGVNCKEGRIEEGCRLMNEMVVAGLDPYDETLNELLICSYRMGGLEKSISLFDYMLGRGLLPSVGACNAMVKKLCDNGEAKKADEFLTILIDRDFVPDEAIYSNLIHGYGRVGSYQQMLKLYYEMQGKGPPPGLATYTALVKSLCHCGRMKEAEKFAKIMRCKSFASLEHVDALSMKCKDTS